MSDLIERQAAIDALHREYNTEDSDYPTEYQLGLSAGRRIIDELPSAQPEQRWIPVSEMEPQLPCIASDAHGNPPFIPNGILYLTTEKHGECYMDAQYLKDGVGLLFENRIVAWMPLPEPYREEGGQK